MQLSNMQISITFLLPYPLHEADFFFVEIAFVKLNKKYYARRWKKIMLTKKFFEDRHQIYYILILQKKFKVANILI